MSGDATARSDRLAAPRRAARGVVCVYKIGGSLLSLPDLPCRIEKLIGECADCRPLLVVGGGGATDLVRDWDRIHQLGEESAHRIAVGAMSLNAALVNHLLPGTAIVGSVAEAELAWDGGAAAIIHPELWLARYEADVEPHLAHDWSVTSDSIAAWIALQWPGAGLVLAKSIDPPAAGLQEAAGGHVDAAFPTFAAGLRYIDWVNLRGEPPVRRRWWPASAQPDLDAPL